MTKNKQEKVFDRFLFCFSSLFNLIIQYTWNYRMYKSLVFRIRHVNDDEQERRNKYFVSTYERKTTSCIKL